MKKFFIYLLFYGLAIVSIGLSGVATILIISSLSIRALLLYVFNLSENTTAILLALLAIPFFVFVFQLFQDINYQIIHRVGFWALGKPKFSYRGITVPAFYERNLQTQNMKASIRKSKYRYRIFSIFEWFAGVLTVEFVIGGYWCLSVIFGVKLYIIIFLAILLGTLWLTFFIFESIRKRLHLEIAYVENNREFYYKMQQDTNYIEGRNGIKKRILD